MKTYFLNVQDAYRQPVAQLRSFQESASRIKAGMQNGRYNAAVEAVDVYCIGTVALKLIALPFFAVSAHIIGKVFYNRCFSYKGLLLAGITFSGGHDLSKMGQTLQEAHNCAAINRAHHLGERRQDETSPHLLEFLSKIVSKVIALKVGDHNMDREIDALGDVFLNGRIHNGRIHEDADKALKGTIANDFMISVNRLFS